jgi:voltage-gated potassium channel Kch
MNKPSFSERFRYWFDNLMSKGTASLIGWLAVVTILVVVIVSMVVWLAGLAPDASFVDLVWTNLMETLDAEARDDSAWAFRLIMLAVTFASIFITSMLIGVLTAGIESKIEDLQKGRSKVVEVGHTVILGWSEQIFAVLSELIIANANQRRSCIVILGERDKVGMEDEIRDKVGDTGRTRIVCRRGNPMTMSDLEIVSLNTAKSIIVLSPQVDDPDLSVIKTLLAIVNNPARREDPYHIVAELRDPKNVQVVKVVGRDEVELVLAGRLVARIMAQTCRQSGLSVVYTELLDFAGDEIYLKVEPALVGKTFGEALSAYEDSAVLGLSPAGGTPKLNPPMNTQMEMGDRIIAISEDDDTIRLSGKTDLGVFEDAIVDYVPRQAGTEHVLILGWNWRAPIVINELDRYVAPGSKVTVVAGWADAASEIECRCGELDNLTAEFIEGDTTDRQVLDELPLGEYAKVIVLSYSDLLDTQKADAHTLITLLHLRDCAEQKACSLSIVSEILDVRNRQLAEVARADDFVVSDVLVSLTLSQISEDKSLAVVLEDLFDPDGSEIYLKPAADYVKAGQAVTFYTVVEAALRRGEVAIGYRIQADSEDASKSFGVRLNPVKSDQFTFSAADSVIVLAES